MNAATALSLAGLSVIASVSPVGAATLQVGPGQALRLPSQAASIARDGDTIAIDPGEYFDCAIWSANDLVITGSGPGVVLTDRACEGKASFVMRGNGITVRDLTLTRIRVPDGNGAGIRAEGRDLTIERLQFINNQTGILAGDSESSSLIVRDSIFADNGSSETATADIQTGRIARIQVEGSQFRDSRAGPSITSSAAMTVLIDNRFAAGGSGSTAPYRTAYVIGVMNGGGLAMENNTITLMEGGPRLGAILIDADGIWPGGQQASLRGTILTNQSGRPAVLLRDWNGSDPILADTHIQPSDVAATSDGVMLHRARQVAHHTLDRLRRIAGKVRHVAGLLLRHLVG